MKNTPVEVVGSFCLLLMFVLSGINKCMHFDATTESLARKAPWLPLPRASIVATIALEIVCPLVILHGMLVPLIPRRVQVASAIALVAFTVVATLVYHPIKWNKPYMQNLPFFSNLSVLGGLVLLTGLVNASPGAP